MTELGPIAPTKGAPVRDEGASIGAKKAPVIEETRTALEKGAPMSEVAGAAPE